MFHRTTLRLTVIYLAIIMTISIFFSLNLYSVSSSEIERGIRRQTQSLERGPRSMIDDTPREVLLVQREEIIQDAQSHIAFRLLMVNLFILIGGGMLSYYLARRSLKPIEEAHEAQSRFVADASHELRTPIAAMKSETEVALEDPKLTLSQSKKLLSSNVEEIDKLTNLTDGLLRLARLDSNDHQKTRINVNKLVEDSISKVLPLAEAKQILITPSLMGKPSIQGDGHLLDEMLITILDNAIKYSPKKSEVRVGSQSTKQGAVITVQDDGRGIKPTDLPHIFERFYRSDDSRTKSETNGYGLGLAIAKSIVEHHNGEIIATSKPREGSTFTIYLPAK